MNLLLVAALLMIKNVSADKILAIFAFPGKSHTMMLNTLAEELARRGHEVTVITNYRQPKKIDNYTEIIIEPMYDFWANAPTNNLFELTEMTFTETINLLYYGIGIPSTEHALKQKKIQDLIRRKGDHFDLVLVEQFYQEAFLLLAHKYQAPIVTVCTFGFAQYMSPMFGVVSPWSHVPHELLPYSDKMTFPEKLWNTVLNLYEHYLRQYQYFPQQQDLAQKYIAPHLPGPLPTVKEMEKRVSVVLLNSHDAITPSRPTVRGMVQVGGLHITDKPKLLPADIKEFLDGATHGVIYFSLGTNLKSADLPPEKLSVFLSVFGSLKQRVLWKFESSAKFPPNVMVKSWLPQSDILGHPNVKVFITHGGLFGTQEGVYRSVPLLGIPIYCDQHLNMMKADAAGYALILSFRNITETSLKWALTELIENPRYAQKMQQVSTLFRDRPLNALNESVYWVEYVSRHKGALHIRSSALDLPWVNYMLLDVIFVFSVGIASIVITLYMVLKKVKQLVSSRHGHKKRKEK